MLDYTLYSYAVACLGFLNMSSIPRTICANPKPNIPYPHASGVRYHPNRLTTIPKDVTIQLVVIITITCLTIEIHIHCVEL
jgi:hypothetical protein